MSLVRGQAIDTVRYEDCAALLKWTDGGRELVGQDAVGIRVEPTLWRLKDHAARLDDRVGADRSIVLPYRSEDTLPRPWSRRPSRIAGWMLVHPWATFLTGTIPVAALFLLVVLLAPVAVGSGAAILVWPAMALGVATARTARVRLLKRAAKRRAQRH